MLHPRDVLKCWYGLTERQTEVLAYILDFRLENRYSPTIRDIQEHFGMASSNGAVSVLLPLETKGAIRRDRYLSRSIVPTMRFIPVNPIDSECAIGEKS